MGKFDEKYWNEQAKKLLEGKKIVEARYLTPEEADKTFGWYQRGIVIFFDDGTDMVVSQDDEGNGPGSLFVGDKTLPVISMNQ